VKLDARPLAAHFELDNVDLMITQWEYRAELARQAGLTLANARDKQIAAYIGRAAAEGGMTSDPRGSSFNAATSYDSQMFADEHFASLGIGSDSANRTEAALLFLQSVEDFITNLQERSAPTDGVYAVVSPKAFQDIRSLGVCRASGTPATDVTNVRNVQPMMAGAPETGGIGAGFRMGSPMDDSLEYMGATILKSNHIPTIDYAASGSEIGESRYNLDFDHAGVEALIFQSNCVAALSLQGMKVDSVEDIRRNTNFVVASMMGGTGVIRPECAAVCTHNATVISAGTRAQLRTELENGNAASNFDEEWVVTA
jgi:hypothetical protein